MDRPTQLRVPASLGTAALVLAGLAGCGIQSATEVQSGTDTAPSAVASPTPSTTPSDSATSPSLTLPTPDPSELKQMGEVGIDVIGDPLSGTGALLPLERAIAAASAENGGLMKPGVAPSAAELSLVSTPGIGTAVGAGRTETLIPTLDMQPTWILVYDDAVVPVSGGRAPETAPADGASTVPEEALSRKVSLVVLVDAVTGKFITGSSF